MILGVLVWVSRVFNGPFFCLSLRVWLGGLKSEVQTPGNGTYLIKFGKSFGAVYRKISME